MAANKRMKQDSLRSLLMRIVMLRVLAVIVVEPLWRWRQLMKVGSRYRRASPEPMAQICSTVSYCSR